MTDYVHGYGARERARLEDQARTLEALLHGGIAYPAGSRVLEAGCGTGAQTLALARRSPEALITAVDRAAASLEVARAQIAAARLGNVSFRCADLLALPFPEDSFDHAFVCFVLEHTADPGALLSAVGRVLRPGGTLTVIEGDHGSTLLHPESAAARAVIDCQIALQRRSGGDPTIGRRLFPLLTATGWQQVAVEPCVVYVDASRPALVDGFVRRTFTAMIEGVRGQALVAGLITADEFDTGVRDLGRTAEADGVFCYTFFKATARAAGA